MKLARTESSLHFLLAALIGATLCGCVQNQQTVQKVPSISELETQEERERLRAYRDCSERQQLGKIIKSKTGLDDYAISNCFDLLDQ